jgi:hypothetical protein
MRSLRNRMSFGKWFCSFYMFRIIMIRTSYSPPGLPSSTKVRPDFLRFLSLAD